MFVSMQAAVRDFSYARGFLFCLFCLVLAPGLQGNSLIRGRRTLASTASAPQTPCQEFVYEPASNSTELILGTGCAYLPGGLSSLQRSFGLQGTAKSSLHAGSTTARTILDLQQALFQLTLQTGKSESTSLLTSCDFLKDAFLDD